MVRTLEHQCQVSVPLLSLGPALLHGLRPSKQSATVWPGVDGTGIGCWLPELEFTHYQPTCYWSQLIRAAQLHLAVTGNPLCAHLFLASGRPFLAWIATLWHGDPADRVREFPWHRRLLDSAINSPVLRH